MFTQFTSTKNIKFDTDPHPSKHLKAHSANPEESKNYWWKRYYGDNYQKIMKLKTINESKLREKFFTKYPSADINRFRFEVLFDSTGKVYSKTVWYLVKPNDETNRFDITGDGFKTNPTFLQFLYWPRGWRTNGAIQKIEQTTKHLDLNKILVYVTETEHFNVALSPVNTSVRTSPTDIRLEEFDYINKPWYTRLAGSYVCGYLCGISLEHLNNTLPRSKSHIITAIVRYHFVLWIRRFLAKPELLGKYLTGEVKKMLIKHIPIQEKWLTKNSGSQAKLSIFREQQKASGKIIRHARLIAQGNQGCVTQYEEFVYRHAKNQANQDFLMPVTNGLTKLGSEMFQESMESYIYCILGAQARTRWCITGLGAKSYQTQEVFRKLFTDQVVLTDEIANMRTAIKNTNIRLDFAVSPGMILCSSDLRLKTEIRGFNNVLTVASKFMSFGGNSGVNSTIIKEESHQEKNNKLFPPPSSSPTRRVKVQVVNPLTPSKPKPKPTKPKFFSATGQEPVSHPLEYPILFSTVAASTWLFSKLIMYIV